MNILLVKPGAEKFAIDECALYNTQASTMAPGIVALQTESVLPHPLCFPFWTFIDPYVIDYSKGGKTTDFMCNWFYEQLQNVKVDTNWPLFYLSISDNGFTPDNARQERLQDAIKKRMSRIAKLADFSYPEVDKEIVGLFAVDNKEQKKILLSRSAIYGGQRRMRDDPQAPSRSYLKIEEAFALMGKCPKAGELVADLGAAPGGWTWAALKRGAKVFAIDNGPLKKGPLDHPDVYHIKADAYTWEPPQVPLDWLFCDMVDQPFNVLDRIKVWFKNGWFKNAVVNFKYGYSDPSKVLQYLYTRDGLVKYADSFTCRHLFHDRDEFTVMVGRKG